MCSIPVCRVSRSLQCDLARSNKVRAWDRLCVVGWLLLELTTRSLWVGLRILKRLSVAHLTSISKMRWNRLVRVCVWTVWQVGCWWCGFGTCQSCVFWWWWTCHPHSGVKVWACFHPLMAVAQSVALLTPRSSLIWESPWVCLSLSKFDLRSRSILMWGTSPTVKVAVSDWVGCYLPGIGPQWWRSPRFSLLGQRGCR